MYSINMLLIIILLE